MRCTHPFNRMILLALALTASGAVQAQGYPVKPIRFVVGFAPGGGTGLPT